MKNPAHIVRAKVRYNSVRPHFWTTVVFENSSEIDVLISALEDLKKHLHDENFHVHLQDHELRLGSSAELGEIILSCIGSASNTLSDRSYEEDARKLLSL